MKSENVNFPEPFGPLQACKQDCFTFTSKCTILLLRILLLVAFVGTVRFCKLFTMHKMSNMRHVSHFDSLHIRMVFVSWHVLSITCFLLFSVTLS